MTTVWVRGANAPLADTRLRVGIRGAVRPDVSALLLPGAGQAPGDADLVNGDRPTREGVLLRRDPDGWPAIEVDLEVLEVGRLRSPAGATVERLLILADLPDQSMTFGDCAPATAFLDRQDGTAIGVFPLAGLSTERAVIVLEIYRRAGRWKVRAVGQGYDRGLPALLAAHGVTAVPSPEPSPEPPPEPPPEPHPEPPPGRPSGPPPVLSIRFDVAEHPPGVGATPPIDQSDRSYDQCWAIFEDAARSAAAFESARDFAHQRLEREMSAVVADQRMRHTPAAAAARAEAQRRHDDLVTRASADHRRDTDQLRGEIAGLAGALPAAMADWGDPVWSRVRPPDHPTSGIRIGTVHRAGQDGPTVPLMLRLPLMRPLWIDATGDQRPAADLLARSVLARLLAAHPAGGVNVRVVDLGGRSATALLGPLGPVGPSTTSVGALADLLSVMATQVDMARMAARAGAADALAPHLTAATQVLLWPQFPVGLDETSLGHARFLIEHGSAAGIVLILVVDSADAAMGGPGVDPVRQASLRLEPTPAELIVDPWVGLSWTYTPDIPGPDTQVDRVLARIAASTRGH